MFSFVHLVCCYCCSVTLSIDFSYSMKFGGFHLFPNKINQFGLCTYSYCLLMRKWMQIQNGSTVLTWVLVAYGIWKWFKIIGNNRIIQNIEKGLKTEKKNITIRMKKAGCLFLPLSLYPLICVHYSVLVCFQIKLYRKLAQNLCSQKVPHICAHMQRLKEK